MNTPMLAEKWQPHCDPTGWWLSEKLDGVRALWDGTQLRTRTGQTIHAPSDLLQQFPTTPLDGELWSGRGQFQRTAGIVRSKDHRSAWMDILFMTFDAPSVHGSFESRQDVLRTIIANSGPRIRLVPQIRCTGRDHLQSVMAEITHGAGEGVMLRRPGSAYENRRSPSLRKLKRIDDSDGVIVGFQPGTGRNAGGIGALLVRLASGLRVKVSAGLNDALRDDPPQIGQTVVIQHAGKTDAGMLREPRFHGIRADLAMELAA